MDHPKNHSLFGLGLPRYVSFTFLFATATAGKIRSTHVRHESDTQFWGRFVQHMWGTNQTHNFDWNSVSEKNMLHFGCRFLHLSRHWRYTIYYNGTYFVIQVYLVLVLILCQPPNVAFHIPGWPKRRPCLVSSWRHMSTHMRLKLLITLGDRLINDWSEEESWSLWMFTPKGS